MYGHQGHITVNVSKGYQRTMLPGYTLLTQAIPLYRPLHGLLQYMPLTRLAGSPMG